MAASDGENAKPRNTKNKIEQNVWLEKKLKPAMSVSSTYFNGFNVFDTLQKDETWRQTCLSIYIYEVCEGRMESRSLSIETQGWLGGEGVEDQSL